MSQDKRSLSSGKEGGASPDDVLKRMLATPPPKKEKAKPKDKEKKPAK